MDERERGQKQPPKTETPNAEDEIEINGETHKGKPHEVLEDVSSSIESDCKKQSAIFKDDSTDCAICLGSLDDPDMEVIQLACGHKWHLECIKEQLEQAQPNPAQRLVLTGCRCAKCGSVCDHPALHHLTRKTDALREKIDAILKEQFDLHSESELKEARQKYAMYLCSNCSNPYFGGTIRCADTADGEVPPGERLCVACAPSQIQRAQCRHPWEHRGFHILKCRYCCKVATHVCYGTVHFCQECHDRNSERVARLQRQHRGSQNRNNSNNNNKPPSCLTPIPCRGGDACPYPKPSGATHHKNGPTADCEQFYACGWCQSNPSATATGHAFDEPPGSRNFLQNPNGEQGLRGWKQLNPRSYWHVEESGTALTESITTNFVSSFQWCVMAQSLPLHRLVRDPSQVRLEASAKYMARTDCPSLFRMEVIIMDQQGRPVARKGTNILQAPADFWERKSLIMEPTPRAHELVLVIHGKDARFWRGNFGSKVTDCQVRVLGEREELERVLLPEGLQEQNNIQAALLVGGRRGGWFGEQQDRGARQQELDLWNARRMFEYLLPVLCMLFLAWLLQ